MVKTTLPLQEAIAQYDREKNHAHIEAGEQERQEIVRQFPLDSWNDMPLEKYALGPTGFDRPFSYWIEFNSPHIGSMRGGSAAKHLIYKHKSKPGWYFPSIYSNEQEAWTEIRGIVVQAFFAAKEGDWDKVSELLQRTTGRSLWIKTFSIYFPNEVLSVCSVHHIRHFLERLGTWRKEMEQWEAVRLNRELLKNLREVPPLGDWKPAEIERFLYDWADPRESKRIVKIAPGEEARYWSDCLENQYICVGWDEMGDLRAYEDKDAFKAKFSEVYRDRYKAHLPTLSKKANEVWTLMELEPGDIVIANQGMSKVLAVGEVVEPGYEWKPERQEYRHTVGVQWDTTYAQDVPPQQKWVFTTVDPVSITFYQQIVAKKKGKGPIPTAPIEPVFIELSEALTRKGQTILYGPPGTGKTYLAQRFAIWWLTKQTDETRAQEILSDPEAFEQEKRHLMTSRNNQGVAAYLTWITFHPSYSYEDFVEGFRPIDAGGSGLTLRLEDGIFKRICREAQSHPKSSYLVLIDEINRANLAKVFGELITLLEKDKRGTVVTLPQSKECFSVPPNVFLLGTMNTADRSIKLMDAALRRRFAFIELMPDLSLLHGARIQNLPLDEFLETLNRRLAAVEGREKQIGHAYLLDQAQPVSQPEEFVRRFKQEILPLLQEYCYEEYESLAGYLGDQLVDKKAQTMNRDIIDDDEKLIEALTQLVLHDG